MLVKCLTTPTTVLKGNNGSEKTYVWAWLLKEAMRRSGVVGGVGHVVWEDWDCAVLRRGKAVRNSMAGSGEYL